MASGHVNRIYRPNTWQHRPSLRREDFTCQPGAVHTWHETNMPTLLRDVRFQGKAENICSHRVLLNLDPKQTCTSASSILCLVARNLLTLASSARALPDSGPRRGRGRGRDVHFPKRWTHEPHSHHWCRPTRADPKE